MDLQRTAVVSAGYLTWITFAICMRYYFRRARKVNAAKSWLVRCAGVCALTHMALLVGSKLPAAPLLWTGVAGYATAYGLFAWALLAHGRQRPSFAFIPVAPTSFTAAGPYRLMRHPIYTAYLLAWLAGAVACGQPWLLGPLALMSTFYYRAARQEEDQFLASPLAMPYRAYRLKTGMFLPRLRIRLRARTPRDHLPPLPASS